MPRRKKRPNEMTNDELARFVFPKKVVEKAKEIAHQGEEKPLSPRKSESSQE